MMFNRQFKWERQSSVEMSGRGSHWGSANSRRSDATSEPETLSFFELGRSRSVRTTDEQLPSRAPSRRMILRTDEAPSMRILDETEQSWLLEPKLGEGNQGMIDLCGWISCRRKCFWWIVSAFWACVLVVSVAVVIWKFAPRGRGEDDRATLDVYSKALSKALTFFDIQKSGELPSNVTKMIPWRGSSAMADGQAAMQNGTSGPAANLVGGYYDAGDNIKFAFTQAFAMTLLSWSVIEYKTKFQALGELDHAKELIKWGTDYLLKTFNASHLDRIYCQVGRGGGAIPNDHYCWEKPEDLDFFADTGRTAIAVTSGADLAGEMAAALASAAIVFRDQPNYAIASLQGAESLYAFAKRRPGLFVDDGALPASERVLYNSSSFHDEMIWASTWLYFATGNVSYLADATIDASGNRNRGDGNAFGAFDWDSKLAGAQLLLSRMRLLQGPGYPYEQVLKQYHNETNLVMCAYLPRFQTFARTPGGLILINPNATQHLPAAMNAAFLATLYADYLKAASVPAIECGPNRFSSQSLRHFSQSQVDYALGNNPLNMSYVVGHGKKFPLHPHHRGASFPFPSDDDDGKQRYSCEQGWAFRDSSSPNPHVLEGAMVGGPDENDLFRDERTNSEHNEPTLAGNAGLVGALVGLAMEEEERRVDAYSIFSAIPYSVESVPPPPPPAPWSP